jgi:type IV secretory pathway VirB10-like protein
MDPIQRHERKRQAWQRLRAQKRRAGQLRGRVVAISLIGFALLWATVFVQMGTGHDPVLASKSSKVASSQPAKDSARHRETEAVQPEPVEVEAEEQEAVEAEMAEQEAAEIEAAEVEPEPAPVTTSQS